MYIRTIGAIVRIVRRRLSSLFYFLYLFFFFFASILISLSIAFVPYYIFHFIERSYVQKRPLLLYYGYHWTALRIRLLLFFYSSFSLPFSSSLSTQFLSLDSTCLFTLSFCLFTHMVYIWDIVWFYVSNFKYYYSPSYKYSARF